MLQHHYEDFGQIRFSALADKGKPSVANKKDFFLQKTLNDKDIEIEKSGLPKVFH